MKTKNLVETVQDRKKKSSRHGDTLAKVEDNLAIVDARRWSIQSQVH